MLYFKMICGTRKLVVRAFSYELSFGRERESNRGVRKKGGVKYLK